MAPEVSKVQLVFPRRIEKSNPVGLVQKDNHPAVAAYELMPRDLLDVEAFRWRSDVVDGDVVRWGLGGRSWEHLCSEIRGGQTLGDVAGVVGVPARFALFDGDA